MRISDWSSDVCSSDLFARKLVNSGRLSMPTSYTSSCLNTPDADPFSASLPLGGVAPDGPITVSGQLDWWLGQLSGQFVVALFCNADISATAALRELTALLPDSPLNANLVLVLYTAQEHRAP